MTAKEIGDRIRERRKLLKISQSDVARLASCSKPSVIAAESGKPTLRLEILLAILEVLGLALYVGDEDKTKRAQSRLAQYPDESG